MKKEIKNRRNNIRVPLNVSVRISNSNNKWIKTATYNISTAGFYCKLEEKIPVNTKIALTLLIPAHPTDKNDVTMLDCSGIVVRATLITDSCTGNYYKTAIFFTKISDEDTTYLKNYLDKHTLKI